MKVLLTVISIVFQSIYISDRLLTVLVFCNILMEGSEGSIDEVPNIDEVPHIEDRKDLETLIVASIQIFNSAIKNVVKKFSG